MNWTPLQSYRLTILLIACITLLAALASNQFFLENINSDYLCGFEAARDIIQQGSFAGQNFPIAPYYFPDLFIVMLLNGLTQNITVLHFLYAAIFVLAFWAVVYHLFRRVGFTSAQALNGACFSLIGSLFILPPGIPMLREWSFSHLSVMLCSLFVFSEYLFAKNHPTSFFKLIGLGLFVFLVLISDNLLFVQLFVPLGLMLLLDNSCRQSNKRFYVGLFLLFGISTLVNTQIQGWLSSLLGSSVSYNSSLFRMKEITHLGGAFSHALVLFENHIQANPLFYAVLSLYHVITLVLMVILYRQTTQPLPFLWQALSFFYLSQIINVLLAVAAGKVEETGHFRYFHLIYFYPAISLAMCCIALPGAYGRRILMGLSVACFAIFLSYNVRSLAVANFESPYTGLAGCVDALKQQYAIQNGIADYWNMRTLRMLSKQGVQISQVSARLRLKNFIDNRAHFFQDTPHHTPLTYQFILTAHLPQDLILQHIGKPDVVATCPGTDVWLYLNTSSAAKLNHFFNQQIKSGKL